MPEANYDEEYVIKILAEQAELNLKFLKRTIIRGPIKTQQTHPRNNKIQCRTQN